MPAASLTFTPLTDPLVWFPNVDSFNAFIGGITVSIAGTNLPVPTLTTIGGVKLIDVDEYVPGVVNLTYVSLATEEGVTEVPSKQATIDMKTKLDLLATTVQVLIDQLRAQGYTP